MAFKDDLKLILAGGLPALIDGPSGSTGTQQVTNEGLPATVEQTTPEPQLQDREPFLVNGMNGQQTNMFLGAAIIAGLLVYAVTKR